MIEHHAEFIAGYARSVVLMDGGAVRWHLPVREALSRTGELAEHGVPAPQIIAAVARLAPEAEVPLTVGEATRALTPLAPAARPQAREAPGGSQAAPVAVLTGVSHGYKDVHAKVTAVLDEVDLTLREDERVALVGANGAGKSTMLRLLTGLAVPREGTVEVCGVDTRRTGPARLADHVCHLHQRPEQMFLKDSVREEIAMFPRERRRPGAEALVDRILDRLRLTGLADRDARTLSGGQQRRVSLGIGLASTPQLLLLDEPTSSLDTGTRDDVIAMLAALAEHIRCVVVATHDMHLVAEWADRVVVLDGGKVVADTTPAALFDDPELTGAIGLVPPQITVLGRSLGIHPPPLTVEAFVDAFAASGELIGES